MPKATSCWLAACSAGFGGAPKESTQTIHVLLVLPEQHGQEPVRGYEAQEVVLLVHHRKSAFPASGRLPSGDLLIGARGDHGRVGVHHLLCDRSLRSREQGLYGQYAGEPSTVQDSDVRQAIVPISEEGSADLFYQRLR